MDQGAWIIDCRDSADYQDGFIPGSLFLGGQASMTEWASFLIPQDKPLLFVLHKGGEQAMVALLAKLGLGNQLKGYLEGGFETWRKSAEPIDMLIEIEADELAMDLPHDPKIQVLDVRPIESFEQGHIQGATQASLELLVDPFSIAVLDPDQNLYIHSHRGYRSLVAASLFKRQGYHNLRVIKGGWEEIQKHPGIPLVWGSTDPIQDAVVDRG